ncbi:MAG: ClpXP protease specificity-enhancing factor SspB [Byssovorax sp.]
MSDAPQQPPNRPDAARAPRKKDIALTLLQGPSLFIHLDPRKQGVVVPVQFKREHQLMLQVGLNMAIPIPDLEVDEEGITCTLSFSQRPFWCSIPWSAVYALVGEDSRGMLWPDDVPPELATQMRASQASGPKSAPPRRPRPKLAAVEPEMEESGARKRGKDEPRRGLSAVPSHPRSGAGRGGRRPGSAALAEPPGPPPQRPTLVAVPPPAPSGPGERGSDPDEPRADLASGEEGEAAASARPSAEGKKPKRELPPYLRVIK